MPAIIMTKILQLVGLVAGGSSSGAHRRHIDVTLKMVIIFDPLSRSGLVVGASRERVAR